LQRDDSPSFRHGGALLPVHDRAGAVSAVLSRATTAVVANWRGSGMVLKDIDVASIHAATHPVRFPTVVG
jgi:hypothetical protein